MTDKARYDVFLSHNNADREAVELIARRLREKAHLEPFLDKWHLIPGEPWQEALEEALDSSRTCAVFLGPNGLGTWENEEMRAALDIRVRRPGYRVIPILLPGARMPERGRLPRFLARHTWVDFRPGLDDADALHRLVCGIQGVAPGPEKATEVAAVCPFRGLQVFEEDHARFFFGREALAQHLVEQLREDRFLAVIGPSGSGKSSLVRAGLVPHIREGALPASERWPLVVLKPGPHPLETLTARLLPHLDGDADPLAAQESLLAALRRDERGMHRAVQVALAPRPDNLRLVVIVDQFEELFTLCRDESARAEFIANLLYASAIAGGQTVVVATMRADFFGKCAAYPELAARLAERDVLVGPMSEEELRRAMEGPAQTVGLHYEKGLVDTILDDLGDEPGTLPLLQHTLLELWERRRGGWLTTDAYRDIGGVKGALAQRAEAVYLRLRPSQQVAARRVLLRLTQPGEGTEDTRRRARLVELLPAEGEPADVEAAVRKLADARLLTTGKDELGDEIVDVAHEALIRGWPQLQGWIDEDRAALRTHRRLTEATEEWERKDRDESYLYRGARLAEAEEWAAAHVDDMNPLEREFLRASVETREADRVASRRRVRRVTAGLVVALVIFAGLAFVALYQRNEAEAQRDEAKLQSRIALSRQLAAQSAQDLSADNHETALLLAIEAGRAKDTVEAFAALRQALAHPGSARVIISGHKGIFEASWNPDEGRILTRGTDDAVRVWDAETGVELASLSGHTDIVQGAFWNAGGDRILTHSADGTARVWDAETGAELLTLSGWTGPLWSVAWDPDQSRILTASGDDLARVWDAQTGAELLTLSGHIARWNVDGSHILTGSADGTARVWDSETGAELVTLAGHTGLLQEVSWNADESHILTAGRDDTARVWDAETGAELLVLSGHSDRVVDASWSAGESRILTRGADDSARVWDAETGVELATLSGHENTVWEALWNADGRRILTYSADGTARVWDGETGTELLTLSIASLGSAVWSADGGRILTANEDGTVRVWDAETGAELLTLWGHTDWIREASWNADESCILAVSEDGTARVWDVEAVAELPTLSGHTDGVEQARWSADGSRVLTASRDGTARVWDAATGAELLTLSDHTGAVWWAAWDPDESRILTASADGTVRVWDAETGDAPLTAGAHADWVNLASWNTDGSRILTAGCDGEAENEYWCSEGTARVWDAETGARLLTLSGHQMDVWQAAWNADESRILTAAPDDTVRVWDAETGAEIVVLSPHAGRVWRAVWDASGSRILTAGCEQCSEDDRCREGTARVWDAETGTELLTISGQEFCINSAVWNREGNRILTAGAGGTARMWDTGTGDELFTLSAHAAVWRVVWNADESRILTTGCDRYTRSACWESSARVWDARAGAELFTLSGHTGPIRWAAWNADESRILTASADGTVRQWYTRMGDLLEVACQRAPRNMTEEEWQRYLGEEPYRDTCPGKPALGQDG